MAITSKLVIAILIHFSSFNFFCRGSNSHFYHSEVYDKRINVFDPHGELLQIKYADIAAKSGELLIAALSTENSLVICMAKSPKSTLLMKSNENKLSKLNDFNFVALSGFAGDANAFLTKAKQFSTNSKRSYDITIGVTSMAVHLSDIQYRSTLTAGTKTRSIPQLFILKAITATFTCLSLGNRPYGLNAILMGYELSVNDKPSLFCMSASGDILKCTAAAIGRSSASVLSYLEETFAFNLIEEDLIVFLQDAMRQNLRENMNLDYKDRVDDGEKDLLFDTFLLKNGELTKI